MLVLDGVRFSYGARVILDGADAVFPSGSATALMGPSGSGKTTLVQLVARLYDVSSGVVRVGGRDVREYDLAVLRDAVAVVLQNTTLFSGTIRSLGKKHGIPTPTNDFLYDRIKEMENG